MIFQMFSMKVAAYSEISQLTLHGLYFFTPLVLKDYF